MKIDTRYTEYFRTLEEVVGSSSSRAASALSGLGRDYNDGTGDGISGNVVSSVMWAFYCFLTKPSNFLEAITLTISAGGDTDSTAALTGALSGAYLGEEAIPAAFKNLIHDRGEWMYPQLVSLMQQCHAISLLVFEKRSLCFSIKRGILLFSSQKVCLFFQVSIHVMCQGKTARRNCLLMTRPGHNLGLLFLLIT